MTIEHNQYFDEWLTGCGVVQHKNETRQKTNKLIRQLVAAGKVADEAQGYELFKAADVLCNQAMWLVVHMTYAKNVYLDGRAMQANDFKRDPQGHTGGSLNMVPAYVGYLLANALTGENRDWSMGQGHCVAAVDAIQLLTGSAYPERLNQYALSDEGLSKLVRDFYSYRVTAQGKPESPLGSHVNVRTKGASQEGGYLGFAALHYVHQPLPGEKLVAFLSDGAFEEQRGSDWAARWWRAEDSGLVSPIMIANGRRIDQRTTTAQQGGSEWFALHLAHQGFAPFIIDGRDPAAFACAIIEMEQSLSKQSDQLAKGELSYPVKLPYCIAETEKGYGFPGEATNDAHGLPLGNNPRQDDSALSAFNQGASALFQQQSLWQHAVKVLAQPAAAKQSSHIMVTRPEPKWFDSGAKVSANVAMDEYFASLAELNTDLRVRIGNPDELSSNRFKASLKLLKHRVTQPEPGVAEAIDGKVITALNEEAVICACIANKKGLNLVVSYESFAIKMLGALRQSIIFSRHQKENDTPADWLSLPVVSTSHLWENGKNEQSHQDPVLAEALSSEMADVSRVVYPADANSALACLRACYGDLGAIWNIVSAKSPTQVLFSAEQAQELVDNGAVCLRGHCESAVQLVAIGAYQLEQALLLSDRLNEQGQAHSLVYLYEPGRFRIPRDHWEAQIVVDETLRQALFPKHVQQRLFFVHGHGENILALCRPLDLGPDRSLALGYINQGGTLDTAGMLFANRCTWAHGALALAQQMGQPENQWLRDQELAAIKGLGSPYDLIAEPFQSVSL